MGSFKILIEKNCQSSTRNDYRLVEGSLFYNQTRHIAMLSKSKTEF